MIFAILIRIVTSMLYSLHNDINYKIIEIFDNFREK